MNNNVINALRNDILSNFISLLGFDGDYYVELSNTNYVFLNMYGLGKYIPMNTRELYNILKKINISTVNINNIMEKGLIVLSKDLISDFKQLLITYIHETLHSNRNIIIDILKPDTSILCRNKPELTNKCHKENIKQILQDIYKGSVDTSLNTIKKYSNYSNSRKEELLFNDNEYNSKIKYQYYIDESLIEIISIVSFNLWIKNKTDIMNEVKLLNKEHKDIKDDIYYMTNIIIKHNDLELFKWIIDPLYYSNNDIFYDYFDKYLSSDDLINKNEIMNIDNLNFDDIKPIKLI